MNKQEEIWLYKEFPLPDYDFVSHRKERGIRIESIIADRLRYRAGNAQTVRSRYHLNLRRALNVLAQRRDRPEPQRTLRQLRLNRPIRVKGIGHPFDDAGF
jgi:hypothetical protein